MVRKNDLCSKTIVELFEVREVWYSAQADLWERHVVYGAETRYVGEDSLIGVFSTEEKANEARKTSNSKLKRLLEREKMFGKLKIAASHNIVPRDLDTFGYEIQIIPREVQNNEILEEKGEAYWVQPQTDVRGTPGDNGFIRISKSEESKINGKRVYLPTLWIYPPNVRPAEKILIG